MRVEAADSFASAGYMVSGWSVSAPLDIVAACSTRECQSTGLFFGQRCAFGYERRLFVGVQPVV